MALRFKFWVFAILLLLIAPTKQLIAQEQTSQNETITATEIVQQLDDDTDDVKQKKKDKKKDKVEIKMDISFFINFLIDILTMIIIVRIIYYRNYKNFDIFFTFFLFNIAIFLLTFILNKIKISMGAAFGLFAVFSMLRYRTEGISTKDMTYLFIVIAIGLTNAIQLEYVEIAIIDGLFILGIILLDTNLLIKRELCQLVKYENIDLIRPENKELLLEDLKKRTGLKIKRISIGKIDFLKDSTNVKIYYYE